MNIYKPFLSDQFCVYHTTYSGELLPPNYIGSSSVDKVLNKNYHGTVTSKRYKSIWLSELKLHPELFSTVIVSYHDTRYNAIHKELQIQRIFNVVKNEPFINRAYATKNGCFGMDTWTDRTIEEKLKIGQKISNTANAKSIEEKESTSTKLKASIAARSPKKRQDISAKQRTTIAAKTKEEKQLIIEKTNNTKYNKTNEEKMITKKKKSDAMLNKSIEEKLEHSNKVSNSKGKNYLVIPPIGEPFQIRSLSAFCRNNNLGVSNMALVARGKRTHHKGWKCVRLPD